MKRKLGDSPASELAPCMHSVGVQTAAKDAFKLRVDEPTAAEETAAS